MLGVSYCDRPVSGVCHPLSVVRRPQFASNDISSVTMGGFEPKLIGLFLWRFSSKIAQIVPLRCTNCPPEHKIEKNLNNISSVTTRRISTKLDRFFLVRSSTKIAQTVPLCWKKRPPELKRENTSKDISTVTTGRISIKNRRIVPWEVHYQNCSNRSAPLHKMAARAKI